MGVYKCIDIKGYCTWGWLNMRQFLCRNLQAALPPGSPCNPVSTLLLWFISELCVYSESDNCPHLHYFGSYHRAGLDQKKLTVNWNQTRFVLTTCRNAVPHETGVNLNQTDRIHVLCTPLAISLHRSAQMPKLLIPTLLISVLCWDHSFLAPISLWHTS